MAPSCAPINTIKNDVNQQEAVAGCLEQLRPGTRHFQAKRLAFEIRDVGFTPAGTLSTLDQLVRLIYARATSDPERFSGPCAALCFSLSPILPTFKPPGAVTVAARAKRIDFRQTLLNLCQREFEAACLAAFMADEAATKPSSSLYGSLQFLSYLYLHHLLTDRIMLSCLLMVAFGKGNGLGDKASDEIVGSNVAQRVEGLVKSLTVTGRQLDECLAQQHRPMLDGLYDKLAAVRHRSEGSSDVPPELQASLARLLEMRASSWPGSSPPCAPAALSASPSASSGASPSVSSSGFTAARNFNSPSCFSTPGLKPCAAKPPPAMGYGAFTTVLRSSPATACLATGSASSASISTPPSMAGFGSGPAIRRSRGSSGGGSSSRGSCQNLEGLSDLTEENFQEVRAQLLSPMATSTPASLEAIADEIVECAVAACGRRRSAGGAQRMASEPGLAMEESWAQQMQQQWDEQSRAYEIYVRLCVEALQQMGAHGAVPASPHADSPCCGGAANSSNNANSPAAVWSHPSTAPSSSAGSPAAPTAAPVTDTARAFRRLLLSTVQSHFERCLAALLPGPPVAASPMAPSPLAATPRTPLVSPHPMRRSSDGNGTASSTPSSDASTPSPAAGRPSSSGSGSSSSFSAGQRSTWGDQPAALPEEAEVLPRARGVCHLLLGLLRHGILTPRIVLHCAAALVDGAAGGSAACLQCACVLLAGAGKQVHTFRVTEAAAFESLVKRLQGMADSSGGEAEEAAASEHRRRLVSWFVGGLTVKGVAPSPQPA